MNYSKRKLAVFFPGRKYGVDCPLLYYTDFICKDAGYECMYLHYAAHREEPSVLTVAQDVENARAYVLNRMAEVDFSQYDEILFVSKSIGTVLASIVQQEHQLKVRNIYFTPLEQTLPYLGEQRLNEPQENLILAGTGDSFLDADTLMDVCVKEDMNLYQVEGLGHSMEADDIGDTLEIMKDLMEIVQAWIVYN